MTAASSPGDGAIVTAEQPGTPVPNETAPDSPAPDAAAADATAAEGAALSADERAELERLRAEVADLRSQTTAAPGVAEPPPVR
jgi:hypothetical protein